MRCIENEILMVLRAQKKTQNETSLNEPIGYDTEGKQITLNDILSDDSMDIIDEVGQKLEISKLYEKMKERLDNREKQVMIMRYGLGGGMELTQKQIAKAMGISRSYVSRIETKAISKLKE
jgi:RNA polymerase sporulation-specific sigma factor